MYGGLCHVVFSPSKALDKERNTTKWHLLCFFASSPGGAKRRKHKTSGRKTTGGWQKHDTYYASCLRFLFDMSSCFRLTGQKVENKTLACFRFFNLSPFRLAKQKLNVRRRGKNTTWHKSAPICLSPIYKQSVYGNMCLMI